MPLSLTNQNNQGSFTLQNINNGGSFNASVIVNTLYDFTTFTFTNVNVTGSNPPSLSQFLARYTGSATWTANSAYFTTESAYRGYQVWTVPQTAIYEIEVAGASTGRHTQSGNKIGSGSKMRARFTLEQNQKLLILVGQQSGDANSAGFSAVGGGGGTYVVPSGSNSSSINPLIVAGGGGGNGFWTTATPLNAYSSSQAFGRTTTYGGSSSFGELGGTNGRGGRSHISSSVNGYDGGGGGGFATGISGSGANGAGVYNGGVVAGGGQYAGAGRGFWTGSLGGALSPAYAPPATSDGGFGGGGGAGPICGGGGGGYSGGAGTARGISPGTDGAGGGGSYISSSATTVATADGNYETLNNFSGSAITTIGYHSGSGYVKITLIS